MDRILTILEAACGRPVDVAFTDLPPERDASDHAPEVS
jgi:hypothetical protein